MPPLDAPDQYLEARGSLLRYRLLFAGSKLCVPGRSRLAMTTVLDVLLAPAHPPLGGRGLFISVLVGHDWGCTQVECAYRLADNDDWSLAPMADAASVTPELVQYGR